MPKSRGRNGRRNRPSTHNRSAQLRAKAATRDQYEPYANAIIAANACEADGDAKGALDVIGQSPHGPDGEFMWAPWRIDRLLQMETWRRFLPPWAFARWMVQQAGSQMTRRSVERTLQATDMAVKVQGRSPTSAPTSRRTWIGDHDWVAHQLAVHDLGGLAEFVARRPGVAGLAGDVSSWVDAPMGGYRCVDETDQEIVWTDLASGDEITTLNLGAALHLQAGRCVIGRMVTSGDVRLFDIAPAPVGEAVAEAIAASPGDWVDVITASADASHVGLLSPGQDGALLTDLSESVWRDAILDPWGRGDPGHGRREIQPTLEEEDSMTADAILGLLRQPLDDELIPLPCFAAALLSEGVWEQLVLRLRPEYATPLGNLARRLAGPAADICQQMSRALTESA
ncbi:MAG: hypothetical protein L0H93_08290 [Nocardioides sp.]|nr:hypothetical protein [Nocardioides sp.]